MSFDNLSLECGEEVARLILNRAPLNILHIPMLRELSQALDEVAAADNLKVFTITGAGRAFCAGVDVADHTRERAREMLGLFHGVIRRIMNLRVPVIAMVNGLALGGGWELAMACDLVLARDDAKIGQPEIQLGVFPPVAAALMPGLVGRQRTLELLLTGRVMTAAEGERIGLVTRSFPADEYANGVEEVVSRFVALSRPVLCLTKRAVIEGMEMPLPDALERADFLYLEELMRLEDPHEGLAAFLEKRQPTWKDR